MLRESTVLLSRTRNGFSPGVSRRDHPQPRLDLSLSACHPAGPGENPCVSWKLLVCGMSHKTPRGVARGGTLTRRRTGASRWHGEPRAGQARPPDTPAGVNAPLFLITFSCSSWITPLQTICATSPWGSSGNFLQTRLYRTDKGVFQKDQKWRGILYACVSSPSVAAEFMGTCCIPGLAWETGSAQLGPHAARRAWNHPSPRAGLSVK